jgi:hypothetical protein
MSGVAVNFRTLLFSFNRAMQLDATLRSYLLHCADPHANQITVLYKATGDTHPRQYALLVEQYAQQDIRFVAETRFKPDVLSLLFNINIHRTPTALLMMAALLPDRLGRAIGLPTAADFPGYTFFIVDDVIFIQDFNFSLILQSLAQNPDALGFSLRLGANTVYCYTKNKTQRVPEFTEVQENIFKFDWTRAEFDFSYPLEISSSVYRRQDLFRLFARLNFNNPNLLETTLAKHSRQYATSKPYLLCFESSAAFSNPINIVQTQLNNRSGKKPAYTPAQLAQLFSDGYRIDPGAYDGYLPNSCHEEVDLAFYKP